MSKHVCSEQLKRTEQGELSYQVKGKEVKLKLFKSKFNYPKLINSWCFNLGKSKSVLIEQFDQKPVIQKSREPDPKVLKVIVIFTFLIYLLDEVL